MKNDLYYAVKAFVSILSGYKTLQYRDYDGEWQDIEGPNDHPYYVCALFNNGRHIPLPIIIYPLNGGPLQAAAILLASIINPLSFLRARRACKNYLRLWDF